MPESDEKRRVLLDLEDFQGEIEADPEESQRLDEIDAIMIAERAWMLREVITGQAEMKDLPKDIKAWLKGLVEEEEDLDG